ncbi:MAG: hypothetical protein H6Q90_3216 [Deltaproteobacteria bacterium]|nr:hypothetical protein [Deltaproteobacteria bacterium]
MLVICGAIAAVVGLVGGGAYYFFKVYAPGETRQGAQAEIERWEHRFSKARACLLGATPASSRPVEALALRELSPDPWDRGTCTRLVSELSRGDAEDTGLIEVEQAWNQLDQAASHVATGFISHVDPGGELPKNRGVDPLPGALEELDLAHAALRTAAGMGPPTLAGGTRALRPAEILPVRDGADPVTSLDLWLRPSVGGVFALGNMTKTTTVQLQLAPGTAPKIARIDPFARRSLTDPAWGAMSRGVDVDVGPIDDAGTVVASATHLKPKAPKIEGVIGGNPAGAPVGGRSPGAIERTHVLFALGNATAGVVAYVTGDTLTIARSAGGVVTQEKPIEAASYLVALDPAGRAFLVWATGEDGELDAREAGAMLSPGVPTRIVPLGTKSEDLPWSATRSARRLLAVRPSSRPRPPARSPRSPAIRW